MGMNSMKCSQCEHYIEANAGEGKIYGCDRSKCVFEPNTKNDLGVDLISRADVNRLICKYRDNAAETGNERDLERAYGANKVGILISELPSVTPQTPRKGHWILTDVEGNRVWHCNCSECGKDPQDYVGGSENWWLIKSKLPKFCPRCGSDNSEVEE